MSVIYVNDPIRKTAKPPVRPLGMAQAMDHSGAVEELRANN